MFCSSGAWTVSINVTLIISFFTPPISFWLVMALFIYCMASSKDLGCFSAVISAALFSFQPLRNASLVTVFLKYSGMPSYPSVARSLMFSTNSSIVSSQFCLISYICLLIMWGWSFLSNISFIWRRSWLKFDCTI